MLFQDLNLDVKLLKAIEKSNFSTPTDIQQQAIPLILEGQDLMASAQTGTGKTAAFVLPVLQRLITTARKAGRGPRVLILTPTRELALQVNDNIRQLSRFCTLFTGNVVGGMPYPPQIKLLSQPLDILVATPGRLLDHMEQGRIDFSRLEVLVLDEADRMLDMGFVDAVTEIAAATPADRQTLLFSATLEGKVQVIARKLLKNPARIQLAAMHDQHAAIHQQAHRADDIKHKRNLLTHYLLSESLTQAVIFTATKRGADDLANSLVALGHASAALHGDMGQSQRKRTVDRMRHGKVRFLVATDVAARGLDIKGISHVINFDLPMVAEDYIHRIGRTGRGGAEGIAVSLVGPEDWSKLNAIERLTGRKLDWEVVPGLEPTRSFSARPSSANRGKSAPHRGNSRSGAEQRPRVRSATYGNAEQRPQTEFRIRKPRLSRPALAPADRS